MPSSGSPARSPVRERLTRVLLLGACAVGVLLVVTTLTMRALGIRAYRMPSDAMAPSILVGDWFWAQVLRPSDVRHGTIVIFRSPVGHTSAVKRVIGMPGDRLAMKAGVLTINGRVPQEPYLDSLGDCGGAPDSSRRNWGPVVIPTAEFFVLGDNRDCSIDSRQFGPVARDSLKAQPWMVYFSYDADDLRIRWDRIGHRIR